VPPTDTLRARVERALSGVQNPRVAQNVVTAGMVQDLAVDDRGQVTFTFLLSAEDPGTLARDARKAVQAVAGSRA
jgi:metal-sulfur cluster biosynthetic enzyme